MKEVKLPFSYMWLLKKLCGTPRSVLDVGCGDGELMSVIADKNWKITGIDIYADSVKKAKKRGIYQEVIKGDLNKVCEKLISEKKKYDLVFSSQVIEHITKKEGEKMLDLFEKLARKRIYVGTPRGFMNQPEIFLKGNPYQVHKSGWSIEDFTKRGYKVRGVGFYPSWSENGLARSKNRLVALFFTAVSYIFSPIVYVLPLLASGMMSVKEK